MNAKFNWAMNIKPNSISYSVLSWKLALTSCANVPKCTVFVEVFVSVTYAWFAGHVIPPDQLLPIALARGSSGLQLDFTYQSRAMLEMVDPIFMSYCFSLLKCCMLICIFFRSTCSRRWSSRKMPNSFIELVWLSAVVFGAVKIIML